MKSLFPLLFSLSLSLSLAIAFAALSCSSGAKALNNVKTTTFVFLSAALACHRLYVKPLVPNHFVRHTIVVNSYCLPVTLVQRSKSNSHFCLATADSQKKPFSRHRLLFHCAVLFPLLA